MNSSAHALFEGPCCTADAKNAALIQERERWIERARTEKSEGASNTHYNFIADLARLLKEGERACQHCSLPIPVGATHFHLDEYHPVGGRQDCWLHPECLAAFGAGYARGAPAK